MPNAVGAKMHTELAAAAGVSRKARAAHLLLLAEAFGEFTAKKAK
jgi:hypothetical protein